MEESGNTSELLCRHVALEGSYNIRDIGGYAALDGRSTRWRTFLRADSLSTLSVESQRLLLEYPVRTIIDLRRTAELRKAPALFADSPTLRYVNISLLEDEQQVRAAQSLQTFYRLILETCQEQIRQIFTFLAAEALFPCLVHCTIGKDRTGLITALLLSLAGVPAHIIAHDYALSERYLAPFFTTFRAQVTHQGNAGETFEWLLSAHPETMLATLAYLEEQYGSVNAYLRAIGMTNEQLERLHSILVE